LLILSLPARSQKLSMDTLHQGSVGKQIIATYEMLS
jgi:hypothetical protein